jgi:TRAP-type uncharacterized transport system substrate-binding protein
MLLLAVAVLTFVPSLVPAQQKVSVIFSAGPTGGTWTPMAGATAEVIKKKFPELDVQVEPGAALVNMEKIRNDKADLGWSMTNVLADARDGKGQWAGKQTDKALYVANYYANVWQLVVPADSEIRTVKDLRGKPVALPARGNTSLAAGWFTVVPASFILDLGSAMKLRMVPVSDAEFAAIQKINPGFVRHTVKAGTYKDQGITEDVQTFQAPTILVASSKTPADVIYKVTKAIVEGRDSFAAVSPVMKGVSPADMAQNFGMPYHPGAAKYYKEAGILKP